MSEFSPREFIHAIYMFLMEGGEDDATAVLNACHITAAAWDYYDSGMQGLILTLECSRPAYDILSDTEHPIRQAVYRAIEAVMGGSYYLKQLDLSFAQIELAEDHRNALWRIQQQRKSPELQPVSLASSEDSGKEIQPDDADPDLCFVIMSFSGDAGLSDFYEKAVKPVVQRLGYRCERVDEQHFNDSIRARILLNIRRARFIVADMTEARPNCYYELGIAHALGKEVIHLARDTDDIHFDIKDFNFIMYAKIDELKQRLRERIVATVGAREHGAARPVRRRKKQDVLYAGEAHADMIHAVAEAKPPGRSIASQLRNKVF